MFSHHSDQMSQRSVQWLSDQSVSDKVTYWAVCGQLKMKEKRSRRMTSDLDVISFPNLSSVWKGNDIEMGRETTSLTSTMSTSELSCFQDLRCWECQVATGHKFDRAKNDPLYIISSASSASAWAHIIICSSYQLWIISCHHSSFIIQAPLSY